MKNKVTFKDLHWSLKLPIFFVWFYLFLIVISFLVGLFIGLHSI